MLKAILGGAAGIALIASTMAFGSASAQTPMVQPRAIDACTTIDTAGAYIVGLNLQSTAGDCIDISAPNVALNLGSHTIAGAGTGHGVGVRVLAGAENAHLSNGIVRGFDEGIVVDAPGARIGRMTVEDNLTTGVLLQNADNSAVADSIAVDNGAYGLAVQGSNGVSILSSYTARNGVYGIWLNDVSYSFVAANRVGPAGSAGIVLGCSPDGSFGGRNCAADTHNQIKHNSIDAGNGFGIVLSAHAAANAIVGNTNSNGSYGAFDMDATCGSNVWQGNTFTTSNASCIG